MAVNTDALFEVIGKIQEDVKNVLRKLGEPDTDSQLKVDNAVAALQAVDAALDAIAPDAIAPDA